MAMLYQLLLAVALSAQATDVSVNKATEALFQIVKTPQDLLDLGLDVLVSHIRTIGLFNTKAKNALAAARILVEAYGGQVPEDRDSLQSLPGVGRKTANVVLQMYWPPAIAVIPVCSACPTDWVCLAHPIRWRPS